MATAGTCLWFDLETATKAVKLYTAVVPSTTVTSTQDLHNDQQTEGRVKVWGLDVCGSDLHIMGADGNQEFTMAHSMWLELDNQAQIDRVWDGFLEAGGKELACGWIVDPFGVSWQVLPQRWSELTQGDPAQAQRVAEALWQMTRIDVAGLEAAARGESA